jgi:transcription-repair coupling factor (superfamily II helicase)
LRPDLRIMLTGRIPEAYVPEQDLRLSLYARLARLADPAALTMFAHELEDRFGPRPPELDALIALHRLRLACASRGVARVDAGPRGVALTGADGLDPLTKACGATVRDGRVLLPVAAADPAAQVARLLDVLGAALRS